RQRDEAGDRVLRQTRPASARLGCGHHGRDRRAADRAPRATKRRAKHVITLKTPQETAKMHEAGRIVAEMLAACRSVVRPGVTTGELDRIAADVLKRRGATSNFKGYGVPVLPPFPGVICTSVNEQVVHGIPGKRRLKAGEILSIDAGAIVEGWHADAAVTVPVGEVSAQAAKLIAVTDEALRRAIGA